MKVPDTAENLNNCMCGDCPSYPENDKKFYCSSGKSAKTIDLRGCICKRCPVWAQFKLNAEYYCVSGQAK